MMIRMIYVAAGLLMAAGMVDHARGADPSDSTADQKKQAQYEVLFDGTNFDGWKQSGNWVIEGDAMFRAKKGGAIVYQAKPIPNDFELCFEWKVAEGSNSGVYYRPGQNEYQVLDNQVHADGKNPRTSAASIYFCMAPSHDATKPVGQWNTAKIVCKGTVVQHWLNGKKVVDLDYADPKWAWNVDLLRKRGGDLTARGAHLSLQDHGNPVWYRAIKLRELTDADALDHTPITPQEIPEEVLQAEAAKLKGIIERRNKAAKRKTGA